MTLVRYTSHRHQPLPAPGFLGGVTGSLARASRYVWRSVCNNSEAFGLALAGLSWIGGAALAAYCNQRVVADAEAASAALGPLADLVLDVVVVVTFGVGFVYLSRAVVAAGNPYTHRIAALEDETAALTRRAADAETRGMDAVDLLLAHRADRHPFAWHHGGYRDPHRWYPVRYRIDGEFVDGEAPAPWGDGLADTTPRDWGVAVVRGDARPFYDDVDGRYVLGLGEPHERIDIGYRAASLAELRGWFIDAVVVTESRNGRCTDPAEIREMIG